MIEKERGVLAPELRALMGIYEIHRRFERMEHELLSGFDLSRQERHAIACLVGPVRIGQIAKKMQCLPSSMTPLVDGLQEKGLIEREPDPEDRRASRIVLTEKGQALQSTLFAAARKAFYEVTQLSADDTAQLAGLMDKARRNMTDA